MPVQLLRLKPKSRVADFSFVSCLDRILNASRRHDARLHREEFAFGNLPGAATGLTKGPKHTKTPPNGVVATVLHIVARIVVLG